MNQKAEKENRNVALMKETQMDQVKETDMAEVNKTPDYNPFTFVLFVTFTLSSAAPCCRSLASRAEVFSV